MLFNDNPNELYQQKHIQPAIFHCSSPFTVDQYQGLSEFMDIVG